MVQKEHYEKYNLQYLLNLLTPNCNIVQVDGLTEGAACTTLLAKEFIDNDEPLILTNSDQLILWDSNETLYAFNNDNVDGGIVTFPAHIPSGPSQNLVMTVMCLRLPRRNPSVITHCWYLLLEARFRLC